MAITDKKISEVYSGRDISSLSDNPNQSGMSASALKARFDQLGKEIIPNYNALIDELNGIMFPSKVNLDGVNANIDRLQFNTATLQALNAVGQIRWNDTERTLELRLSNDVTLQIGKETLLRATNKELTTISNGKACYISGGAEANVHTKLATNTDGLIAQATIGVATEDLIANESGYICTEGIVGGINTDSWNEGDILYLGVSGALINVEPVAPTPKIFVGVVLRKHLSLGSIYVKVRAVPRLQRLSDVLVSSIADGHALIWNGTTLRFENESIYNKTEIDNLLKATNITNTPSGNISSNTVQGAINELDAEKVDKLMATNLVTNGDFSNGTTGWTLAGSILPTIVTNIVRDNNSLKVSVDNQTSRAHNTVPSSIGDKIYSFAQVYLESVTTLSSNIIYQITTSSDVNIVNVVADVSKLGQWQRLSDIATATTSATRLSLGRTTNQTYTAYFDSTGIINLTATFGAGKEPTKEQMDWLLAQKFTNSWFNGTAELTSILDLLTLVNTKANITQEAWITPTLLNGATGTIQYRKNQFGRVEFKGTLNGTYGTNALTLPTGYRPLATSRYIVPRADSTGYRVILINSTNGSFVPDLPSGTFEVDLTGMSYQTV